jgi:hypothetical protein
MSEQKLSFQAEVSRLLDIVANSLYSNKEIFLRELISNASDACDRLRYAALTQPELTAADADYKITLASDAKARTLSVADNGIGMNRDEMIENLGTIARSGTAAFVRELEEKPEGVNMIGPAAGPASPRAGAGSRTAAAISPWRRPTMRRRAARASCSSSRKNRRSFSIRCASSASYEPIRITSRSR